LRLFTAVGDKIEALDAKSFRYTHAEARIQAWADLYPALINDGQPMLSLGKEIVTRHNHAIDNLYLDGSGTLVAAELKRGRSPRDVVAQVLDYAAFINTLNWASIEGYCRKRQGKGLDEAFEGLFGWPLVRPEQPPHRLVIVAESYDARVTDAALYLINGGLPLSLIQFTYFDAGDRSILDVRCVLGEIPRQSSTPFTQSAVATAVPDGYAEWLLGSLAKDLEALGRERNWDLRSRLNKASLPFGLATWPLPLGECQLRADLYKSSAVCLRLSFRKELAPGLLEHLEAQRGIWDSQFPGEFENPPYPTVFANLTRELPRPKFGDQDGLDQMTEAFRSMADALVPIVEAYFKQLGGA